MLPAGAALACGPNNSPGPTEGHPSSITGAIVGAAHEAGHRLRDGDLPAVPAETREVPVVIVGGGIAGLSAGWTLRRAGFHDFEVLEMEDDPGGNSRWGQNEVSAYPWAAHYLPVPTPESTGVLALLDEMGLVRDTLDDGTPVFDERHLCHEPHTRLFHLGRWQQGLYPQAGIRPEEEAEVAAFEAEMTRCAGLRDASGRPLFAIPVATSGDDGTLRHLDQISMAEYLEKRGWTGERLRWYLDYCCRDDYGATTRETSAWAGIHYFAARPNLDPEVFTWPEGNGRIVSHLVQKIDSERVRTGQMVYGITDREGGVDVDVLDLANDKPYRLRTRRVIFALPRFLAPYLLRNADGPYQLPGLETFTYSPWMVANITVQRLPDAPSTLLGAESTWDNVFFDSPSLGYIVSTHQDLRMTSGESVLTYYLPLSDSAPDVARHELLARSWDDWVALILDDMRRAHPGIEALVRHVDVMLLGHAMIRPTPGFMWGRARALANESFGAVSFAHSDMSGLSIFEEAQYWGIVTAQNVLRRLSVEPSTLY